jgi:hypothetical protein
LQVRVLPPLLVPEPKTTTRDEWAGVACQALVRIGRSLLASSISSNRQGAPSEPLREDLKDVLVGLDHHVENASDERERDALVLMPERRATIFVTASPYGRRFTSRLAMFANIA